MCVIFNKKLITFFVQKNNTIILPFLVCSLIILYLITFDKPLSVVDVDTMLKLPSIISMTAIVSVHHVIVVDFSCST